MPLHDVALGLFLLLALSKDTAVFGYFRQAWDTGVTGVYGNPFTQSGGEGKSWEELNWQSSWPLLVLEAYAAAAWCV